MINKEERTIKTVYTLSNEITDELYVQYMKEMLRESEEQFKNGEFITLEELKTYIDGLEAKYENNNKQRG